MYQYRNVLVRMRQGDSDRDIARSKTMGRKKIAQVREIASERGWLAPEFPLPDDGILSTLFARKDALPASCISTLEPWREQVTKWHAAGIQGSTIHATLVRNHGYTGSYSSMYRFLGQLVSLQVPDVPLRLTFNPADAVQVDFGSGPPITDVYTGEIFKTWFFVMTLCWSRHQYAEFVRDQTVATWLGCHRRAFESFSGVPSRAIIDNAKCAITKACVYEPNVQRAYAECAEGYRVRQTKVTHQGSPPQSANAISFICASCYANSTARTTVASKKPIRRSDQSIYAFPFNEQWASVANHSEGVLRFEGRKLRYAACNMRKAQTSHEGNVLGLSF